MIKRIGCCHLCGNRPILEIPLKNGVDFGHTPDLPNEAAQWATIYGIMNPTHRRSHQGILVTLLNNSWLHLLGDPTGHSVKKNPELHSAYVCRIGGRRDGAAVKKVTFSNCRKLIDFARLLYYCCSVGKSSFYNL